jgi:hypothetical protein
LIAVAGVSSDGGGREGEEAQLAREVKALPMWPGASIPHADVGGGGARRRCSRR